MPKPRAPKRSKIKVIVSGDVIELYEYDKPIEYGYTDEQRPTTAAHVANHEEESEEERQRKQRFSASRTRNNVRRLVSSNFDNRSKFVTLTFRDNVTDLQHANRCFDRFMKRLRRRHGQFKYLVVVEFQKRGAVHYHMISTLPYIPHERLQQIWEHGFVRINAIDKVDNIGAYVCKYMTKSERDERLSGKKAYFSSRNLHRPVELRGESAINLLKSTGRRKKCVFTSEYESEYAGKVRYTQYIIRDTEK